MTAFASVLGLTVCVVCHVLVSRGGGHGLVVGVASGGASVIFGLSGGHIGTLAASFMTYLLLAYCYVIGVFNLGESSRRIRLLIELAQAPGGAMTLDEILVRYNARMVVEARLGRLVAAGQLIERDGRYWIGNRVGLHIGNLLAGLTPFLVHRRR